MKAIAKRYNEIPTNEKYIVEVGNNFIDNLFKIPRNINEYQKKSLKKDLTALRDLLTNPNIYLLGSRKFSEFLIGNGQKLMALDDYGKNLASALFKKGGVLALQKLKLHVKISNIDLNNSLEPYVAEDIRNEILVEYPAGFSKALGMISYAPSKAMSFAIMLYILKLIYLFIYFLITLGSDLNIPSIIMDNTVLYVYNVVKDHKYISSVILLGIFLYPILYQIIKYNKRKIREQMKKEKDLVAAGIIASMENTDDALMLFNLKNRKNPKGSMYDADTDDESEYKPLIPKITRPSIMNKDGKTLSRKTSRTKSRKSRTRKTRRSRKSSKTRRSKKSRTSKTRRSRKSRRSSKPRRYSNTRKSRRTKKRV